MDGLSMPNFLLFFRSFLPQIILYILFGCNFRWNFCKTGRLKLTIFSVRPGKFGSRNERLTKYIGLAIIKRKIRRKPSKSTRTKNIAPGHPSEGVRGPKGSLYTTHVVRTTRAGKTTTVARIVSSEVHTEVCEK